MHERRNPDEDGAVLAGRLQAAREALARIMRMIVTEADDDMPGRPWLIDHVLGAARAGMEASDADPAAAMPGADGQALRNAAALFPKQANMPIGDLMAQYEAECCDFSDREWVRRAALRHVATMPDSQVRCLLYALATEAAPGRGRTQA